VFSLKIWILQVVRAGLAGSLDAHEEVPWDLVDRYLLPLLAAHASAVVLGTVLNTLRISQVSSWTLFFWFIAITLAVLWFYHNLQVSSSKSFLVPQTGKPFKDKSPIQLYKSQ